MILGEYSYCKPSSPSDCPEGYVCDQSFVLGRSICCKEGDRNHNTISTIRNMNYTQINGWKSIVPPKSTQEMIVLGGKMSTGQPW